MIQYFCRYSTFVLNRYVYNTVTYKLHYLIITPVLQDFTMDDIPTCIHSCII